MSFLEPKTKKGEIAKLLLVAIGLTGLVLASAVAPNLLQLLPRKFRSRYSTKSLNQSIEALKRKGLLKLVPTKTGFKLILTAKGEAEFLACELGQKSLKRRRWDKKWRLLIFDIAEVKRDVRQRVRSTLSNIGFYRLQDSVWVYPYECEEILELLRAKYGVRYEALYIRAEKITNDRWLKHYFSLE